ncbi:hypothetical protein KUV26_20680 [Leisingera daeponensis]|uniref:Uncharacterized protein n=1 Tax=Leisingera daeponensis TaxID=405746 RepID=A0ABS7NKY2_9RHOB|nr:hypothetical protein [Leisingera daeponensis]MBY6141859.1 hypothetical protein [Leisingera daeponensis]
MNSPEWLKPGLCGAVTGAVLAGFVGFTWGGWVTGGTSNDRAMAMARNNVVTALVPVCLDMARTDAERDAKLAAIRAVATFRQRDALMEAGWATVPGAETPDRDIAQACLAALGVGKSPERPENTINEG